MCYIKQINGSYTNQDACFNLINYATGKHCQSNIYGATGVLIGNAEEMTNAMKTVKDMYGKTDGRQMLHFVVEFSKDEINRLDKTKMLQIGYDTCQLFHGNQCVFGYHDNTEHLHMHVVVNSVSYVNGLKYGIGVKGVHTLNREVNMIVSTNTAIRINSLEELCECLDG